MARINFSIMYGQVRAKPKIWIDDNGEPYRAVLSIKVLRRPLSGQLFDSKLYIDCPVLMTKNKEMIKKICELNVGDMIIVRGTLTTKEVIKRSICPHCGIENKAEGNIVYINPIMIKKEETKQDETTGIQLLKEHNEISNLVDLIGFICRAPVFYKDATNKNFARYQIAVNRRYRIHEDPDTKTTDYPWIRTYGLQAMEDSKCLNVGSEVYISGAIQTREITRKTDCSNCAQSYEWGESVMEVVPYYIGYLSNCNVDKTEIDTVENLNASDVLTAQQTSQSS